jgi:lysophospholipase L1-like esterase
LTRWLLGALALALAMPVQAQQARPVEPVNRYPAPGMMEQSCPASRDGLWALDPQVLQNDWAWLCRFREDNARVDPANPPEVVFMGDSITENWLREDPALFGKGWLNRGLSGQTSPQMLVRFWQDVIALHPDVVHIMAGTNDLAGNTGPTSPEAYKNNIRAMVQLAKAHGIVVVLGSIPPADRFEWAPQHQPAPWIAQFNAWLKDYAAAEGMVYADYFTVLAGPNGELRPELGPDGVHPNAAGYVLMRPVAERALADAFTRIAAAHAQETGRAGKK